MRKKSAEILDGFNPASVERAASLLRKGDVVAFPTETVYGLGALAFDAVAVAKIFEVKKRPRFDPLIVHVADRESVARVAAGIPPLAARLMARFWPGPLTVVLEKEEVVYLPLLDRLSAEEAGALLDTLETAPGHAHAH